MQGNSIYDIFLRREIAFQTKILLDIKSNLFSHIIEKYYWNFIQN